MPTTQTHPAADNLRAARAEITDIVSHLGALVVQIDTAAENLAYHFEELVEAEFAETTSTLEAIESHLASINVELQLAATKLK
jgi:hypothetical protein